MCRDEEKKSSDLDRELERLHDRLDKKQKEIGSEAQRLIDAAQVVELERELSQEQRLKLMQDGLFTLMKLKEEEAKIEQAILRNEERLQGAWCLMLDLMRSFSFFVLWQPLLPGSPPVSLFL